MNPGELAFAADRHFADRQVQRKRRAVSPKARDLSADADDLLHARLEIPGEVAIVFLVIRRRHQHVDVPADDLGLAISEQSLGGRIERFDAPVGIDDDDRRPRRIR